MSNIMKYLEKFDRQFNDRLTFIANQNTLCLAYLLQVSTFQWADKVRNA